MRIFGMSDEVVEPAGFGVIQLYIHAVSPAFQQTLARAEIEFALGFLTPVALEAVFGEQRADVGFEELHTSGEALGMICRDKSLGRGFDGSGPNRREETQ